MRLYVLALSVALGSAGCTTSKSLMPQAEKYPISTQKKPVAVQHWDAIAADVAAQTKLTLDKNNFLNQRALYIAPGKSVFEQSFSKYMISNLVARGIPVANNPQGAVEVKYDVQVVQHSAGFNPANQSYVLGSATAGVAGFWILRDAILHASRDAWITGTVGIAAAHDIYKLLEKDNNLTKSTNAELVISTSISDNGRYQMHKTDAYYIEEAEASLFQLNVFKNWGVVQ